VPLSVYTEILGYDVLGIKPEWEKEYVAEYRDE
jgi:hypothetical protein